ncbi:unnamed protein product [Oncorhynchus mykiss]|uniref:Zinc finger and BTB domain containing 33 n=1 Tax=Oncorhynchus mykiss TaxID=8022 RepID=A0A060WS44_ONCMY|nr:unnamed protein product [Oncorhynchus mykiss]
MFFLCATFFILKYFVWKEQSIIRLGAAGMSGLKLISATDTRYSGTVLKSMNRQRNNGLFCDVTIIIQDRKFRAHKNILSASSTYFHQLFSVAGQVIELNFIKAEIFEEILNYIYSSKIVRIRSDMLNELINAGQVLGVKFIANLGVPLSQVKGLPGLSKDTEHNEVSSVEKSSTDSMGMMPIVTESFSLSAEEFSQTDKSANKDQDSDEDDIMFVSETDATKKCKPCEIIDLDGPNTEEDSTLQGQTPLIRPMVSPDTSSNIASSPAGASSCSTPTTPARIGTFTPEPISTSLPSENNKIIGIHKKQVTLARQKQQDHYELIMDGKTFFVCMVCKRPYVCLTSLRRHFNTHSWEKKYPCHYCDKVFALAEYRTKHEIYHTGERRYQCLLCNEMLINYQLLSTHCKQAHNQDPSGRKQKDDTDNNLYRLLPCKTVQFKTYSYETDNSDSRGVPIIQEDGSVQHINPGRGHLANPLQLQSTQGKMLNWDDIFVEPEAQPGSGAHRPGSHPIQSPPGSSEFEFVIPETY